MIKEYFANYFLHTSDVTFHMDRNHMEIHKQKTEPWKVTLVDTGEFTLTGGRLAKITDYIDDTFCFTYGDGVSSVNIRSLIDHHKGEGKQATLTAVKPPGRFGALSLQGSLVNHFQEKPDGDSGWIYGGFFVLDPSVLDLINGDDCSWEHEPLSQLASNNQLSAYLHEGFWQPMDTIRDKQRLEELWASGNAPWKNWDR